MILEDIIKKLELKSDLNTEDLQLLVQIFSKHQVLEGNIEKLVIAWDEKGYKANELKTLADSIFEISPQVNLNSILNTQYSILDMCGTGGDKTNTFNISTLAAIVATTCGAKVIKHSGRSTTSVSGSVDVLNGFGLSMDLSEDLKRAAFLETGLMFVSSKILRELFGTVKQACKKLGSPGFINLLGPLLNPYHTDCHLLGVSSVKWGKLIAETLKDQHKTEAMIVCSIVSNDICVDELTLCGTNMIWHLKDGIIHERQIAVQDLGLNKVKFEDLIIKDQAENKQVFENILRGSINDPTDKAKAYVVALNAGGALYLQKKVKSISDGYYVALKAIQEGLVWEHFHKFLNCNKMKS